MESDDGSTQKMDESEVKQHFKVTSIFYGNVINNKKVQKTKAI